MLLATASGLSTSDITILMLSLAVLLGSARLVGELAKKLGQPAVLGEILAGIVLGPTLLAGHHLPKALHVIPNFLQWSFPMQGPSQIALEGLRYVAVTLLMLVAGLEVNLSTVARQGKSALLVSSTGIFFPFVLGFGTAILFPMSMGMSVGQTPLTFALFVGIALSITALPVIAKTLLDLDLFRSDMGMMIMASAMVDDLVGWIGFAFVLAMMQTSTDHVGSAIPGVGSTLLFTLVFLATMLTLGRAILHRVLPLLQAHLSWPGGVLSFVLVMALLCSAFTEYIGIHAIFGAFIAGVAIGDSKHLHHRIRDLIHQFITYIFAPVFFAGIGLRIDFIDNFTPSLVLLVFIVAVVSKVGGCYMGARAASMSHREGLAVGFGMCGRGAMEIILGTMALKAGLITDQLFVALVVMALVTSLLSGPLMQWALGHKRKYRLSSLVSEKQFIAAMQSTDAQAAIGELAARASVICGLPTSEIQQAVWQREQILPTGVGEGLAVPHARLAGLKRSIIVIGRSPTGINFHARDEKPAQLICLLLTPERDHNAQIQLLEVVARTFSQRELRHHAMDATTYTEFLTVLNQVATGHEDHAVGLLDALHRRVLKENTTDERESIL